MSAPVIPGGTTQAVAPQTGTYNFVQPWYAFFQSLLAYVSTGPIGPVPLVGVSDGSNAAAGNVGEYLSSLVPASPGIALTNDTHATITQLTLTPGDWDLWGEVAFGTASATTVDQVAGALWTTPGNAIPAKTLYPADGASACDAWAINLPNSSAAIPNIMLGPMRVSITVSVTFYLSAFADFGASTLAAGGAIRARRMR